jgi:CBS domain-containing protein
MGLDEVANLMINKDVEQFPVVSEGKLTGFLSRADIIRKLFGR